MLNAIVQMYEEKGLFETGYERGIFLMKGLAGDNANPMACINRPKPLFVS